MENEVLTPPIITNKEFAVPLTMKPTKDRSAPEMKNHLRPKMSDKRPFKV